MHGVDIPQLETFAAGTLFAQTEGIIPAPESCHAIAATIRAVSYTHLYSDLTTLSTVFPADIESFSILKNASETALYGSRGASGVIRVTTKKGSGRCV